MRRTGQSTTKTSIRRDMSSMRRLINIVMMERMTKDPRGATLLTAALEEDKARPMAEIADRPAFNAFYNWLTREPTTWA